MIDLMPRLPARPQASAVRTKALSPDLPRTLADAFETATLLTRCLATID